MPDNKSTRPIGSNPFHKRRIKWYDKDEKMGSGSSERSSRKILLTDCWVISSTQNVSLCGFCWCCHSTEQQDKAYFSWEFCLFAFSNRSFIIYYFTVRQHPSLGTSEMFNSFLRKAQQVGGCFLPTFNGLLSVASPWPTCWGEWEWIAPLSKLLRLFFPIDW